MSDVILYGAPQSNYVRAARMACLEKGVAYTLEVDGHNTLDALKSEAHRALHPFGKIPAFRHGDKVLYETAAILRYVDEAFDGPSLQPADVYERARMSAWLSAAVDYLYDAFIRGCVLAYAFPAGPDGEPDRAVIDAAVPRMNDYAGIIDRTLDGRDWLVGASISLADLMVMPILVAAYNTPEGQAALKPCDNVGRLYQAMAERPSMKETDLAQAAAA